MKKYIALLYSVVVMFVVAGCGNNAELEKNAKPIVNKMFKKIGSEFKCVRVNITEKVSDGIYKAKATLDPEEELDITITEKDDQILVNAVANDFNSGYMNTIPKGTDKQVKELVIQIVKNSIIRKKITPVVYQRITGIPVSVHGIKITYDGLKAKAPFDKDAANTIKMVDGVMAKFKFSLSNIHTVSLNKEIKRSTSEALITTNGNQAPLEYTSQITDDGRLYVEVLKIKLR